MRTLRNALCVVLSAGPVLAWAQTPDGGNTLPLCDEHALLKKRPTGISRTAATCLERHGELRKTNYVVLELAIAGSGKVDAVDLVGDGEPLSASEASCVREQVSSWKLPPQKQACRYGGFLLNIPRPKCEPEGEPIVDPTLDTPFRLGLAMDVDGFWLAGARTSVPKRKWSDLSATLDEVQRTFPSGFPVGKVFLIVRRTATPDFWVDDLEAVLYRNSIVRIAVVTDDVLSAPAAGCRATQKELTAWRAHFKSLPTEAYARGPGETVKSFVPAVPRPSIDIEDLKALVELCGATQNIPRDWHNSLIAAECSKSPSCAGDCAKQMMAFADSRDVQSLASCKSFESVRAACSPIDQQSCAYRWLRGEIASVAATARANPLLAVHLPKDCAAASLSP